MTTLQTRIRAHACSLAVFAAAPCASAAIVHSGLLNINIPSTVDGLYLNVVTGQMSTSASTAPLGWDVNFWGSTALNLFTPTTNPGGGAYVGSGSNYNNIPYIGGISIGASSTFSNTGTATLNPGTPLLLNSTLNGVGFRFINEANGNQIHYGYARFAVASTASAQPRFLVEYFYESTAGQTLFLFPSPGPTSLGLLALSGTLRRRRN